MDAVAERHVVRRPAGDVEPVRVRELVRIAVDRGREGKHPVAFADRHTADLDILQRDAARRELDRGEIAQQFLDRRFGERRIGLEGGELVGMLQQQDDAQRDHVGRRVVPGAQNHRADVGQILAAQVSGDDIVPDHPAQHVVGGLPLLCGDQLPAVFDQVVGRLRRLVRRLGQAVPAGGALQDVGVVLIGRAEQLAHHQRRQIHGEIRHQVAGRALFRHGVEQVVGQPLDLRLERQHPLGREFAGEHAPEMVVARVVHADEGALQLVDGAARFGNGREIRAGERAAEALVQQDFLILLVARQQPGALAVPKGNRGNRAGLTRNGVFIRQVELPVAPEGKAGRRIAIGERASPVVRHGNASR